MIVDKIRSLGFDVVDADSEAAARAAELHRQEAAIRCGHPFYAATIPA